MSRLKAANRLGISVAFCAIFSSCVSSVTSYEYADDRASDGLVYALPKSELVIQATYRLSCQTPQIPAARIMVTDLALTSRVIADQTKRFVIDPAELSNLTTSVQPAKFNFKNGMLTRVEYKADSQIAETIVGAVKLATTVTRGGFFSADAKKYLHCDEQLSKAANQDVDNQAKVVAMRQADYDGAFEALLKNASAGHNLALAAAESRLVSARAALKSLQDSTLVRTVAFTFDPVSDSLGECRVSDDKRFENLNNSCRITIQENSIGPLRDWYKHLRYGPEGTTADIKWDDFRIFVDLGLETDLAHTDSVDAPLPGATGYRGIYYRRGVTGTMWVKHINSTYLERFGDINVLQMGSIGRLEMRNGPFEKRGFTVEFDDTGQLVSYEATSIAPAPEALETAASLPKVVTDAQTARLQQEIDILKKRKELIDAQTALDAAQSQ